MTLKQAIKDPSWLLARMSNQKVEGNDGPGFRHVNCPEMLWEDLVRLVEGLKVEEGARMKANVFKTTVTGIGPWCVEFSDGEIITTRSEERAHQIALAAQHLKREQEPAPRETRWMIVFDDPDRAPLFFKGIDAERIARETHKKLCDSWTCELFLSAANLPLAAQPPQELVSLREALQKHRYDYDDIHLRAKCSCGWEYDAAVGRHNGWDWWAIHFEAPLASDFAETEKAIRNLSWDESCNGKWTAVVRVEHVLAILRAALTRGEVGG